MKLYLCRRCGKLCRRGTKVCWNCGVRWPCLPMGLSLLVRLLSNRFSWTLAVLLVGAFVLDHVLPPTEKEQLAHKNLENGRPVAGLRSRAVVENRQQSASRDSSRELKIEVEEDAAGEKYGPEEKPALDVERRPAETFERANDDPSIDTWSVQVAAFRDESDAEMVADRLKQKGYETFIVPGERWHRVLVGEFGSFKEAGQVKDSLAQEQGFSDAFIRKG